MRVLVAGSTGAIGRQLTPLLEQAGHDVVGFSSSGSGGATLQVNGLDARGVTHAVKEVEPEAVVNLMTAIPHTLNPRRLARDFQATNALRTRGLKNLIDALGSLDVLFVHQGLAYAYRPAPGLATEDDALWADGPAQFRPVVAALQRSEETTFDVGGTVLRFGHLYGPGTAYAADGSFAASVKAGRVPLVGGGHAVFSFTHVRDAADAIARVLTRGSRAKVYNVVDNTPAPLHEWLPVYASRLNAPPPKTAPVALARLAVGGWGVAYMNQLRGASNARVRAELDWLPAVPSWQGVLGEQPAPA